jgi:hypothetical protein
VHRRAVLAGSLAVGAAPFLPSWSSPAGSAASAAATCDFGFECPRPATEKHVRPIMFPVLPDPVLGKASWSDTYLAPRGGGRRHEGQDLMGKKMLKLLACADATVIELRHGSSGNSLYLKDDEGWYYAYLHINNDTPGTDDGKNTFEEAFAPGLKKGDRVTKGQHIAYLGDSGNAEGSGAHLHFEIRMPHEKWYNAPAVNAAYSLEAAEPASLGGGSTPEPEGPVFSSTGPYVPYAEADDFLRRQALDFLGVAPSAAWLTDATARLDRVGADEFIRNLMDDPAWATVVPPTIRLYSAYFLRRPDTAGLKFWVGRVRGGVSLDAVSQEFAGSKEFKDRYGRLGNAEFVQLIYQNVFKRQPDNGGLLYWTQQLDHGKSRGWVMRQMCESPEYVGKTSQEVGVIATYLGMLQQSPAEGDLTGWATMARANDGALSVLISHLRTSEAYSARVRQL